MTGTALRERIRDRCQRGREWLVDEVYSKEADALLTSGSMFIAPSLVFAESVNALWVMHQRGDISGQDLSDAVDTLLAAPITLPVSMPQLSAAAARLASDLGHPRLRLFLSRPRDSTAVPRRHR